MSISKPESNPFPDIPKKTSRRLMVALRLNLEPAIGNAGRLNISGQENLEEIPKDKPLVIVTTHISDIDVQAVTYALGNELPIKLVNQSTQFDTKVAPQMALILKLAGQNNFIPVDFRQVAGQIRPFFNRENYRPMEEALKEGHVVIIAGHNPSYNGILPDKGGYGAVYLAQLAGAVLLPVAVNLDGPPPISGRWTDLIRNLSHRPRASVIIGKPLTDLDKPISPPINNSQSHADFKESYRQLRKRSVQIMQSLAALLPKEKRGKW